MNMPINTRVVSDSSRFDFEIYPRARNVSPGISTIQEGSVTSRSAYKPLPSAPVHSVIHEIDHYQTYNDRDQLLQSNSSESKSIDIDEVAPLDPPQHAHTRSLDDPKHNSQGQSYQQHVQQQQYDYRAPYPEYDDESIQLSLPKLRNRTAAPSVTSNDTDYYQLKQKYFHKPSDNFTEVSDVPQNAIVDAYAQPSEYDPIPPSPPAIVDDIHHYEYDQSRIPSQARSMQNPFDDQPSNTQSRSVSYHQEPYSHHNPSNTSFEFLDYSPPTDMGTPSINPSVPNPELSEQALIPPVFDKSQLPTEPSEQALVNMNAPKETQPKAKSKTKSKATGAKKGGAAAKGKTNAKKTTKNKDINSKEESNIKLKRGSTQKSVADSIFQGQNTRSLNGVLSFNNKSQLQMPSHKQVLTRSFNSATDPDLISQTGRRQELEQILIHKVMARPLGNIPGMKRRDGTLIAITLSSILHAIEVSFAIVVIGLSSAMIHLDPDVDKGIYIYLLIEASTLLVISCLLLFGVMTFEHNNGIFYCLFCAIMSIVAFGFSIGLLIPAQTCNLFTSNLNLCSMRRAISSFIIISTFVWVTNCVTFLTVYYISKLDLLPEINWDYDDLGFQIEKPRYGYPNQQPHHLEQLQTYDNMEDNGNRPGYNPNMMNMGGYNRVPSGPRPTLLPGERLKEYILNEKGSLYEVNDPREIQGKNKVIVYTV